MIIAKSLNLASTENLRSTIKRLQTLNAKCIRDGIEYYLTGQQVVVCKIKGHCPRHLRLLDGVERIEGKKLFASQTRLKSIYLPDSLLRIPPACFANCANLESIRFSENLRVIPADMCKNCSSLTQVNLMSCPVESIGTSAFHNCTNLEEIYLPKTLKVLQSFALSHCPNLRIIHTPSNVKHERCAMDMSLQSLGTRKFSIY